MNSGRQIEKPMWTREDSALASAEGWDVFDNGTGMVVERIDDPDNLTEPRFEGDFAAEEYVKARAIGGSTLHRKAMVVTGSQAGDRQ